MGDQVEGVRDQVEGGQVEEVGDQEEAGQVEGMGDQVEGPGDQVEGEVVGGQVQGEVGWVEKALSWRQGVVTVDLRGGWRWAKILQRG